MAKLVLLTDTHCGIKNGSEIFHDNMELFYKNIFFTYLHQNSSKIDGVIHLGDVFHDRRKIDTLTAKRSREYFFTPLVRFINKKGIKFHIIAGNHDLYHKSTLDVNSLQEFIQNQDFGGDGKFNIEVHLEPSNLYNNICVVPWITSNNRESIEKFLANTTAKHCFGHFEFNGFSFSKVQVAKHGDDPKTFKKFKNVFSGHYHYRHSKDNIHYLGSPTQQTWIDVNTSRGFHVFDTDTGDLEFISNPYDIFRTVKYGEKIESNCPAYYRLYVTGEEKQSDINKFIESIPQALDVDVISTKESVKLDSSSDVVLDNVEDTPTFIRASVDDEKVANIIISLYNRALNEN